MGNKDQCRLASQRSCNIVPVRHTQDTSCIYPRFEMSIKSLPPNLQLTANSQHIPTSGPLNNASILESQNESVLRSASTILYSQIMNHLADSVSLLTVSNRICSSRQLRLCECSECSYSQYCTALQTFFTTRHFHAVSNSFIISLLRSKPLTHYVFCGLHPPHIVYSGLNSCLMFGKLAQKASQ